MEFGAASWTILWFAIQNIVVSVWNAIVSTVEWGANKIVDMINWLIRQALKIPGASTLFPGLREIESLNFSGAKGEIVDLSSKWTELMAGANVRVKALEAALAVEEEITQEVEKQEEATQVISKNQMAVNAGLKFIPETGDVFDPKVFKLEDFKNREAFDIARGDRNGRGGVTITIENINGLDPEEISKALSNELSNKVSL